MRLCTFLFALSCLLASCWQQEEHIADNKTDEASIFQLHSRWHTEEGQPILLRDLKGKTLVVVMIYTACNTACPRLVADMKAIHQKIPNRLAGKIQYVLVSIDPENDTPEKLKAFAISRGMDGSEWTFLQGDPESVHTFANVLAVKYKAISPIDFSHSNIISVFNPEGVLVHQMEGLGVNNTTTIQAIMNATEK